MKDGSGSRERLLASLNNHAPLWAAGVLGAFTVVRVFSISRFDPITARAILEWAGTTNVLLASAFGIATIVLGPVLLGELLGRALYKRGLQAILLFLVSALYVLLLLPFFIFAVVVSFISIIWLIRGRTR